MTDRQTEALKIRIEASAKMLERAAKALSRNDLPIDRSVGVDARIEAFCLRRDALALLPRTADMEG